MSKQLFTKTATVGLSILLVCFLFSSVVNAQTNSTLKKVYIKIEIKGMACAYCAYGMEKELKKVSGVNNVAIELEEGMAYISTPKNQEPEKKMLSLIIQNAGFTPGKIEYSNKPYKKDKN